MRAIIVLAGGRSSRFGRDKALTDFGGQPLISHIMGKLQGLGDEYLVCIGKDHAADDFRRLLPSDVLVIRDNVDFHGPLAGFVTALNECKSDFCFLGACDMPFVEPKIVEYLFSQSFMYSGAVPKWRDGRLEPLYAVYDCNAARDATRQMRREQALSMISLVDHIPRMRFVNVEEEIASLNPALDTFRNLNTPKDLSEVEDRLQE